MLELNIFQICSQIQPALNLIKSNQYPKLQQIEPMSQPKERTHKVLILAGDQSPQFDARDYKKIINVIVIEYLSAAKQPYEQYLLQLLPAVIRRVPLKQHFYAALLGEIYKVNQSLGLNVIKQVISNLETDINKLLLHQAINAITFLSQLMNLDRLNSQNFLDILDDIVTYLEGCKNPSHRAFLTSVFFRTLPNFCHSLNKKVFFQFKKLMQRCKKFCAKNAEYSQIYQQQQKGTLKDQSIIYRLFDQWPPSSNSNDQIQQNIKLNIKFPEQTDYQPIEYQMPILGESDTEYQQFIKNEGYLYLIKIEQLIELMKLNSTFLLQKLNTFVEDIQAKNQLMRRYFVDLLIGKALKSKTNIVETNVLAKLVKSSRDYALLVEKALNRILTKDLEHYDLDCEMKFTEVVTFIVINWPGGPNDMTDMPCWDWDNFVNSHADKSTEVNPSKQAKTTVVLKLICIKMVMLNELFRVPECLKKYAGPDQLTNPAKYKSIEQIEVQQQLQGLFTKKVSCAEMLEHIKTQSDYEIFLQSLFEKTSQSHTHLQILIQRYEKVLQKYKQDYDWTLLNTIRSYWSKSLFHRILYLETMIEKGYVDFDSYVKNIAKVAAQNEQEKHWIKIELNELHHKFSLKL